MLSSKQISRISKLKSSGLSQREITKKTGISRTAVIRYSNPKILKPILQRNEVQSEKIETIREEIKETRQDSKAIRKELKRARSQQDRADDTYQEAWYKRNEIEEEIESTIFTSIKEAREKAENESKMAMARIKWDIEHQDTTPHWLLLALALRI